MAEGEEWKTAFRYQYSLFEFRVIPIGLINTPAVTRYLQRSPAESRAESGIERLEPDQGLAKGRVSLELHE